METEATLTIEITNGLGSTSRLIVNGNIVKPDQHAAYAIPAPDAVIIQRLGGDVIVTIPNATESDKTPNEGICVCISSNISFKLTPTASMNITLQAGYLPGSVRGVRCGDGDPSPDETGQDTAR